jgi:hypothetical protein
MEAENGIGEIKDGGSRKKGPVNQYTTPVEGYITQKSRACS